MSFRASGLRNFPGTPRRSGPEGTPVGHRHCPESWRPPTSSLGPAGLFPGAGSRHAAARPDSGAAWRMRARGPGAPAPAPSEWVQDARSRGTRSLGARGLRGAGRRGRQGAGRSQMNAFGLSRACPVCAHTLDRARSCKSVLVPVHPWLRVHVHARALGVRAQVCSYVHECACVLVCAPACALVYPWVWAQERRRDGKGALPGGRRAPG